MPGGIGPVTPNVVDACAQGDRAVAAFTNANDIFFHLDSRRVYYDRKSGFRYFVAGGACLVEATIRAALGVLGGTAPIEQMHLDRHRVFSDTAFA